MKKLALITLIIAVCAAGLLAPKAESMIQPYFSGEAVNYNGRIYIGTVNTGRFELFNLENNHLVKKNIINPDDAVYNRFIDLALRRQGSRLYAYLTSGRYLYQYNISDPANISLVKKLKDNSGDNFYALSQTDDNLATVGNKGAKLWNENTRVINTFDAHSTFADNISFSRNANYIYKILRDEFSIIDSFYRNIVMDRGINIRDDHVRHIFNDDYEGAIYLVDDYSLKKIYFDGHSVQFNHISNLGYDADGLIGGGYVYFSDGIGIVKIRKSDMAPVDWAYTTELGAGSGWAMGLRVVENTQGQEIVIVFNGSSLLVFDSDLNLIDSYNAGEAIMPAPEPLFLSVDKNRAAPNSLLSLRGNGFGANEEIKIKFAGNNYIAQTDQTGFFKTIITVPEVKAQNTDIKATGAISGLTYSLSFLIE